MGVCVFGWDDQTIDMGAVWHNIDRFSNGYHVRLLDEQVPLEGVASVVESFDQGWNVEVSEQMEASEYLSGLDEIAGLREAAIHLAGGDSPARIASAIEFILEGLHLSNRLNRREHEKGSRYTRS